jgi:two-component sensor histidine kinase
MTILETENHNLRRRMRELEMELRSLQAMHARVIEENVQLKDYIQVLEKQLKPGADGRVHGRVDVTFRVDGANSRGEASRE